MRPWLKRRAQLVTHTVALFYFPPLIIVVVVSLLCIPFGASSLLSMSWFALVSDCLTTALLNRREPAGWPTFSDDLNSFSWTSFYFTAIPHCLCTVTGSSVQITEEVPGSPVVPSSAPLCQNMIELLVFVFVSKFIRVAKKEFEKKKKRAEQHSGQSAICPGRQKRGPCCTHLLYSWHLILSAFLRLSKQ